MTHMYVSTPRTATNFGRTVFNIAAQFRAWNNARKTRAILSKLSPHVLNDIGLNPGDIDRFQ